MCASGPNCDLEVASASKSFASIKAVEQVSIKIQRGQFFGLIGPNGAGKSTLFDLLAGETRPTKGEIFFEGKAVTKIHSRGRASLGIGRTFQIPKLVLSRSVIDNVVLPAIGMQGSGSALVPRTFKGFHGRAMEVLEMVGASDIASRSAGSINAGQQRLVELARALITSPKVLLLDEPTVGLSRSETEVLRNLLTRLNERGMTIVLISHSVGFIMPLVSEVAVMNFGKIIASGTPGLIRNDPLVKEVYLGGV